MVQTPGLLDENELTCKPEKDKKNFCLDPDLNRKETTLMFCSSIGGFAAWFFRPAWGSK